MGKRCAVCGRLIDFVEAHQWAEKECMAHVNRTGEGGGLDVDCNGNGFQLDVRDAIEAPLLRAALAEALDIASKERPAAYENVGPDLPDEKRIAELRAKFLGGESK